jgi:uncharacterized protein (TIGR02001 family)
MKKFVTSAILSLMTISAQATITGNVSVTSDYRFRGISQSQGATAIQGGIDYTHSSGFYAGNWNSSVSSDVYLRGSGVENDLYAGIKKTLGPVSLDFGTISYFYPKARTGAQPDKYNSDEIYFGAAAGAFSLRVNQSLKDYFGAADSRGTRYTQVKADVPVKQGLVLNAAYGRTNVTNQTVGDYDDWRAGATVSVAGFDLGLHYHGTEKTRTAFELANTVNGERNYDKRTVFTVSKSF